VDTEPRRDADDQEQRRLARDAAVASAVHNTIGLCLQLGVLVIIAKRDWVARQVIRYRWYVRQEWRKAAENKAVAELMADLSAIEHAEVRRD
jgi:hypothetical protein